VIITLGCSEINPYMHQIEGCKFLYQNMSSVVIAKFNMIHSTIEIIEKIQLPGELLSFTHAFYLNGNIYGSDMTGTNSQEFIGFNPVSKEILRFGPELPEVKVELVGSQKNMLFAKAITVKPSQSLFAAVYDKFPVLRIYSKDGSLEKEIWYKNKQDSPHGLIQDNPSEQDLSIIMQNYRKIKSTNNYIYALYIGKTSEEIDKDSEGLNDFSNEIHIWDWNGDPIKKIILDKEIFSFCVTEDDKFLICSSLNDADRLYKYSIQ